jgi:hypothetical protein
MNALRSVVALLTTTFVLSGSVPAQDLPKAEKHPNAKFYTAYYIKFKPGKIDEGRKIITDYFEVAGKNSDNRAIAFNYQSGNWHHVVYFPWAAASDLEWKMSPAGERWWAELAKHVGGAQKAKELMARWGDLVADEKWEITIRSI